MVVDLEIGPDRNVFIDETGDLSLVKGRSAFEQRVQLQIQARYNELLGSVERENVRDLTEVEAKRAVAAIDELDSVAAVDTEFDDEKPETLNVRIIYDTSGVLEFQVN